MAYAALATGDPAIALDLCSEVADLARRCDAQAFALEADVNRAMLLWTSGRVADARALALAARTESIAREFVLNQVWAEIVLAQMDLVADPLSGRAAVLAAVTSARRIGYPVAEGLGLRALAWGSCRTGDTVGAAGELDALFDVVAGRGGIAFTRAALLGTAEVLHVAGNPVWRTLAASALAQPVAGPSTNALESVTTLPPADATPLVRRDAVLLARKELRAILAGAAGSSPSPVPPSLDVPPSSDVAASADPATSADRAASPDVAASADATAELLDRGSFIEVRFAGRTASVKASKGMADIGRLLASPGREFHCLELMGSAVDEPSAGESADTQARTAYRRRIRDLQEQIDTAELDGDLVRAEHARLEMDALVEHLGAAFGLGGRPRRSGGSAERARSAVTQRVRSTIRNLATVHPEFARHLERSLVTGTFCSYRPEHPMTWTCTVDPGG